MKPLPGFWSVPISKRRDSIEIRRPIINQKRLLPRSWNFIETQPICYIPSHEVPSRQSVWYGFKRISARRRHRTDKVDLLLDSQTLDHFFIEMIVLLN